MKERKIFSFLQSGSSAQLEDIFNTVDRLQQFRLDDQRTHLPSTHENNTTIRQQSSLNEQFFEQLSKCQVR